MTGVQSGPTSIRVTWTPPDPLDGVTGYRIDYTTGGGSSDVDGDGGSTNSYTLTGLTNGGTYTISIVSRAQIAPTSTSVEAPQVTLGKNQTNTEYVLRETVFFSIHQWVFQRDRQLTWILLRPHLLPSHSPGLFHLMSLAHR